MYKNILLFLLLGIFCLSFITSAVPITIISSGDNVLEIQHPFFRYHQQETDLTLNFHVYNKSTGELINNTNADCKIHLYNTTNEEAFEGDAEKIEEYEFKSNLLSGNFTEIGDYYYFFHCNSTGIGGFVQGQFTVTESGVEITESKSILIFGLLSILVLFLFISLFCLFQIESYIGKFALYWVSHVFMILITFIGWQIGGEGLLIGIALTGVFRIMFWVLTISVFPMLILSIVWIFYIHTFNEHFQKLIEKGNDTETAFKLAQKKRRGWSYGQ